MTNEELIEEILIKAHDKGIRKQVLEQSIRLMDIDPKLTFHDAVSRAYRIEKQNLKNDRTKG
jgi:hypothetical protein